MILYILYNFQDLFDLKNFEKLRSPNAEKKRFYKRDEMFFEKKQIYKRDEMFFSLSAEVRE